MFFRFPEVRTRLRISGFGFRIPDYGSTDVRVRLPVYGFRIPGFRISNYGSAAVRIPDSGLWISELGFGLRLSPGWRELLDL